MTTLEHMASLPPLPSSFRRVTRVQLIRREIREYLPDGALELLLGGAEAVVEGAPSSAGSAATRLYATVMVTIELQDLAGYFREPADAATAQRLAELLAGDDRVRDRLRGIAQDAFAGRSPMRGPVDLTYAVRSQGTQVLLDADVEGLAAIAGQE